MFYLGRGRIGLLYLFLEYAVQGLPFVAAHFGILDFDMEISVGLFGVGLRLLVTVHCYSVARGLQGNRPCKWFSRWYGLLAIVLVIPIATAMLVRSFVVEPYHIPAGSMIPALRVGDTLLISKFAYGYSRHSFPYSPPVFQGRMFFSEPERGEIAVFKLPRDGETDFIKRLVGLPGDKIQMRSGRLYINGKAVPRNRVEDFAMLDERGNSTSVIQYVETLPNGREYRIIERNGDQGPLDNTPVYAVPAGNYFVLGDNRDNSLDSRVPDARGIRGVDFVPAENLIGRASVIFWNSREQKLKWLNSGADRTHPKSDKSR